MSRGRLTGRTAYVIDEWNLPETVPGGEWVYVAGFNVAEELLRDPEMKFIFKVAIDEGVKVVKSTQD